MTARRRGDLTVRERWSSLLAYRTAPSWPVRSAGGLRTLVVGSGAAGRTLTRDLRRAPDCGLRPIGFLDDDPRARPGLGLPVFGRLRDLRRVVAERQVQAVVIAIPSLAPERVRALAREAASTGAWVRYLPPFLVAAERARAADLRVPHLGTLLGRQERQVVEPDARTAIAGRRVLVTGAGGSIGSELCRQLRGCSPASLHLLDHDESNLHRLQLELDGEALLDNNEAVIADIRDEARIEHIFRTIRPEIVFHAAAHKHLPLLERHPCEGVKSNVLGTAHLVAAALAHGAERFVLISTDKAADPRSVLGATKRLAEMIVQANAVGQTSVCSVRFGNVLGSRGSFLSVLAEQIEHGGPVTVTHPDVTRFFMTVEEAVGLVLAAAPMAEYGETFVLDMGQPVRILDLVHTYAAQLGRPDVEIRYTGLRPGEKLHEVLFSTHEERLPTAHPAISAARPGHMRDDFATVLDALYEAAAANDAERTRRLLGTLLPDYVATEAAPPRLAAALAEPYPDGF